MPSRCRCWITILWRHPSFFDFGCGVMALPSAPKDIRDDPELQVEFPVKALPGLCGRLIWFGERLQS